jgi:hypothetical protein
MRESVRVHSLKPEEQEDLEAEVGRIAGLAIDNLWDAKVRCEDGHLKDNGAPPRVASHVRGVGQSP